MTNRLGQPARPRQTPWLLGLLVGAVLLGLLGMHGLGPVPADVRGEGHTATASAMRTGMGPGTGTGTGAGVGDHGGPGSGVRASAPAACGDHDGDHDGGCDGHMAHADATCASASVAGPPVVAPALTPDRIACPARPGVRTSSAGGGPDGGRAPPSLSELQLLRI